MIKNEQWMKIPGLIGYEANTEGQIRCWWSKTLEKVEIDIDGKKRIWKKPVLIQEPYIVRKYPSKKASSVVIRVWYHGRKTFRSVGALVCETFVRPREIVVHIDGNKYNNRPSNLRWGSRAEAQQIAIARGCSGRIKLDAMKAAEIRRRAAAGERTIDLAKEFGVTPAAVSRIKKGEIWKQPVLTSEKEKRNVQNNQ